MSKGLGKTQIWIRDNIGTSSGASTTLETLRWNYFERSSGYESEFDLPPSIQGSFKRAAETLADRGLLKITKRRLRNFEECVLHYPNKTLCGRTRAIRKKLLPHLSNAIEKGEIWPKYDRAENEVFMVRSMSQRDRESALIQWRDLEMKLRVLFSREEINDRESTLFLQLLARGNELFRDGTVSCSMSFGSLLTGASSEIALPAPIRKDLLQFYRTVFPRKNSSEVQFKSVLHQMAYISQNAAYTLRNEALEILHRDEKEYIESFPGTKIQEQAGGIFFDFKPVFDTEISHLFNQSVFRSFLFLGNA